ncbi:2335_t:CDS:2 [Funneliformis geosporum]|uniref:5863_t:CDS:1 n=1 Tax=Funneliformis geosporum TaxID=1117311 RepID=A0A9W4WUU9_9GLOM|nr:2335_t:CDS:2 [Funneliformis geosporum]CAI2173812.1 5863_t:CDS:2 [Funneliformis geosporum]
MSNLKKPPAKPVNDLIKFWAQQQEKEKTVGETVSKSRPLSPNTSTPPSPRSDAQFPPLSPRQKSFRNTPTSSPPLSPTLHKTISDTSKVIITSRSIQNLSVDSNDESQKSISETLALSLKKVESSKFDTLTSHVARSFSTTNNESSKKSFPPSSSLRSLPDTFKEEFGAHLRPSDAMSKAKSSSQMVQRESLPLVKNVSSLVSRFEKVTSPPASPTTTTPTMKKNQLTSSEPTSPKAMSPIRRNQTIEPLSISQPLSNAISNTLVSQLKRRDTDDDDPFETYTTSKSKSLTEPFIKQSSTSEFLYNPAKSPSRKSSMKRRSNIPDPIIIPSPTTPTRSSQLFNDEIVKVPEKQLVDESKKQTSPIFSPIKSIVSPVKSDPIPKSESLKQKTKSEPKAEEIKAPKLEPSEQLSVENLPKIAPTSPFNFDLPEPIFGKSMGEGSLISRQIETNSFISEPTFSSPKPQQTISESKSVSMTREREIPKSVPSKNTTMVPEPISVVSPKSPISPKDVSQISSTMPSSTLQIPEESLPRVSLSSPTGRETAVEIFSEYMSSPTVQSPNPATPADSTLTSPELLSSNSNYLLEFLPEITPISPFWNPAAADSKASSNAVSPLWKPLPENQSKPISPILSPKPDNSLIPDLWFKRSSSNFLNIPEPSPNNVVSQLTMQEPIPRPLKESPLDRSANSYIFSFMSDDTDSWKFFVESPNASSVNLKLNVNPFSSYLDNVKKDNDVTDVESDEDQHYNPFVDKKQSEKKKKHLSKDKITNSHAIELQETSITHSRSTTKFDDENDENDPKDIKHNSHKLSILDNFGNFLNQKKNSDGGDEISTTPQAGNESRRISHRSLKQNRRSEQTSRSVNVNALRKSSSIRSLESVSESKQRRHHSQHKYKPVQVPKSPYSTTRPQRHTLSPAFILKEKKNILKSVSINNYNHNLPDYNATKENISMLIPHSISAIEYGKINHSLPDLSIRDRHHQYNETFYKNNMTVPDFTRISSITENGKENVQETSTMEISIENIIEPVDPNVPSSSIRITRLTINPFDESEKNQHFLPGTPWIKLPHLDEYIESLPNTEFSNPKEIMTSEEYGKFLAQGNNQKLAEYLFPIISQSANDQNDTESIGKGKDDNNNGPTERGIVGSSPSPSSEKCQEAISIVYEQRFSKLEIMRDFIQFMSLALSFVTQGMFSRNWIYIILASIPDFLSLQMDDVFGFGVVFFLLFFVIGFGSLYLFRNITKWSKASDVENIGSSRTSSCSLLKNHINIFVLTTIYVPITKLSLDAVVWAAPFWPVANPYLPNVDFPDFDSMGEEGNDALRYPKDFCYVTSMKKDGLNFSPFIIALALLNLGAISFWFPITLKKIVDRQTGRFGLTASEETKGKKTVVDEEDNYPHKFLFNGYNDNWGTYKSFIMAMKFFLIFLVVVVSKDNCLFRSSTTRHQISTIAQVIQILFFVLLFISHWKGEPFLYSNFNTAEYWARFSYLITSVIGLLIILNIGPVDGFGIGLFMVNVTILIIIACYLMKRMNDFSLRYMGGGGAYGISRSIGGSRGSLGKKKLEFSLNISSADLDFDRLIKERIWQDTWTKLLLTNEKFKPPALSAGKSLLFSEANYRAPYLLNFFGSVGERHIENCKIVSAVGLQNYVKALTPLPSSMVNIKSKILNNYVGVDMYYAEEFLDVSKKSGFGKAYVVPFPFCVVMCYDEDDSILVLKQEWELQRYLQQNESKEILRRRLVRQMLRALEGKNIIGPCYENVDYLKEKVHYHRGILSIQRKHGSLWNGHDLNPGFKVTITYSEPGPKESKCPHLVTQEVIGITEDFKMTNQLEKLFGDNYKLVEMGLDQIQTTMNDYRQYYRDESRSKEESLTYGFYINIFNNPSIPLEALPSVLLNTEENQHVQSIPEHEYPTIVYLYERMRIVHTSRVHQWWYLFWEDLWNKNGKRIPYLQKYEKDFSPLYRTSICYQPMKRLDLEEFLEKRGLWLGNGKFGLFHSGLLNRIYLYLNKVVFERKDKDGIRKKWLISKEKKIQNDDDSPNGRGQRKTIIGKVGSVFMGINRNSQNAKRPYYVMREEEENDSDLEDVELDVDENISDSATL